MINFTSDYFLSQWYQLDKKEAECPQAWASSYFHAFAESNISFFPDVGLVFHDDNFTSDPVGRGSYG
jgi:hypothetical protein